MVMFCYIFKHRNSTAQLMLWALLNSLQNLRGVKSVVNEVIYLLLVSLLVLIVKFKVEKYSQSS